MAASRESTLRNHQHAEIALQAIWHRRSRAQAILRRSQGQ